MAASAACPPPTGLVSPGGTLRRALPGLGSFPLGRPAIQCAMAPRRRGRLYTDFNQIKQVCAMQLNMSTYIYRLVGSAARSGLPPVRVLGLES